MTAAQLAKVVANDGEARIDIWDLLEAAGISRETIQKDGSCYGVAHLHSMGFVRQAVSTLNANHFHVDIRRGAVFARVTATG